MESELNVKVLPEGAGVVLEHVASDRVTGRVERTEVTMSPEEAWSVGQRLLNQAAEASTQRRRAGLEERIAQLEGEETEGRR